MGVNVQRDVFLAVVWERARPFEKQIRAKLAEHFPILAETEVFWPRALFTKKLYAFYGFGSRFTWWNKARKCGRGAFRVIVFENADHDWGHVVNMYGREVFVDRRVNLVKGACRRLTGHHNVFHASLNADETQREAQALFGMPLEAWLQERRARRMPSPADLEAWALAGRLVRIGIGSRRSCLAIPDTDLCLKGYRSEGEIALGKHVDGGAFKPLEASVVREIRTHRFSDMGNTSCQEWRYYNELKARLPADVMAHFPETLARVMVPSRGWCLVENVVTNADGTPVEKFHAAYVNVPDGNLRAEMLRRFKELEDDLVRHAVRFYDPQNVMVQWRADGGFRLRIVDFEPVSRTWISPDNWCKAFVRMKIRRRFARYGRKLKW